MPKYLYKLFCSDRKDKRWSLEGSGRNPIGLAQVAEEQGRKAMMAGNFDQIKIALYKQADLRCTHEGPGAGQKQLDLFVM